MDSPKRPPIDAPALLEEIESRPLSEQLTAESTYELLRRAADLDESAPALTFLPTGSEDDQVTTLSRSRFLGRIHQTANAFHELGLGPTDVVSTLLPHVPEAHEVFWGAEAAGIVNPINFLLRVEEISELLKAAGTKILVAGGPHPSFDIEPKIAELRRRVPSLEHVIQVALDSGSPSRSGKTQLEKTQPGILDFAQIRDVQPADHLRSGRNIRSDQIAAYFHTGGTTGSPKLARHTHGNQVFTAWSFARLFELGPQDVMLNGLPMFHVAGSLVCSLAPLSAGASVVILSAAGMRHPNIVSCYWRIAERYGATVLGGVPTALAALNASPLEDADLSAADVAITGASPLPLAVGRRFEELTGKPLHEILGMTETAGLLAFTPRRSPRILGSAGYRLPFTEVAIRPWAEGEIGARACAPGEAGMLVVRGPNVFAGYLDPRHDRGSRTRDDFLITGDLGHMAADGRIFLTGRAKDVIIRGGHNIDPVWIESAAERHPDVHLAAAVGEPDPYAGEVPALFVTPNPGRTLDLDEVRAFVDEHIAEKPARPKSIFKLEQLPLTAVGKPFKPELRRLAAQARLERELRQALKDTEFELVVEFEAGGLIAHARCPTPNSIAKAQEILTQLSVPFTLNGSPA